MRSVLFPHLFSPIVRGSLGSYGAAEQRPIHRKPATLETELQDYAFMLFSAEAEHYPRHAHDESELRCWLSSLASCVEAEVIAETNQWSYLFNSHCSALERRLAIAERLKQWIESQDAEGLKRWIDKQRREEPSGNESTRTEAEPAVNGAAGNGANLVTAEQKAQQDRIAPAQSATPESSEPPVGAHAQVGRPEADIDAVMKEGSATPPGPAPYPIRAAWFEHELALREWSIHELRGQGGPDWKTSQKILDGLSVSRGVLYKTAAALSKKKKQVLFRDIPQE